MSFFDDVVKTLGNIAPFICKALPLPPPLGNLAATALQSALGTPQNDPDSLHAALATATPEQIIAITNAEQTFAAQMKQMGFEHIEDLEKIAADDRASARGREIALRDKTPQVLAYGYGLIFLFTLSGFVCLAIWHIVVDPSIKTSIDILLGVLVGMVLGSKEYYFGSSTGSKQKDDTIKELIK